MFHLVNIASSLKTNKLINTLMFKKVSSSFFGVLHFCFYVLLIFCTFVLNAANATPPVLFKEMPSIVAKVNDAIITKYDFDQYMRLLQQTENLTFDTLEKQRNLLKDMTDVVLLEEFCKEQKLEVSDADVLGAFKNLAERNHSTAQEFERALKVGGVDKDVFLNRLKQQIVVSSFRNIFILPKIEISQSDIRQNRERIVKKLVEQSQTINNVLISEIVIYNQLMDLDEFEDVKDNVHQEIMDRSFAEIAHKYSHNPSKENGGKIGWISYKDLSPIYQSIIRSALDQEKEVEIYLSDTVILAIKLEDIEFINSIDPKAIETSTVAEHLKSEKSDEELEKFLDTIRKNGLVETFI